MDEHAQRVESTVAGITRIADRITRFANKLLIGVTIACVGGFWLGTRALQGGIGSVWNVLGGVFAVLAVGAAVKARWRVGAIRRRTPEIASEVRALLSSDAGDTQVIIDEFRGTTQAAPDGSAMLMSQQVMGLRRLALGTGELAAALAAITRVPALALMAVAITIVFVVLAPIFLLALAV